MSFSSYGFVQEVFQNVNQLVLLVLIYGEYIERINENIFIEKSSLKIYTELSKEQIERKYTTIWGIQEHTLWSL